MPIRKFVRKILGKKPPSPPDAHVVAPQRYQISADDISQHALKVLKKLQRHGFEAYLVGGSVRDLLLKIAPKDFDIATNASPEEIQQIFKNCRLIGRRFRLAHILFGRDIIEVATFRSETNDDETFLQKHDTGMVLRDNCYGSLEEDAWRRDFSINALYYDVIHDTLVDHTGGLSDVEKRLIRIIGNPERRYREDPVRMIRAIRFSAKLDFTIAADSESPIAKLSDLILQVSPARLFDEMIKLFHSGHGLKAFVILQAQGLFEKLFPAVHHSLQQQPKKTALLKATFSNTDKRIRQRKPVNPAFLFAALLWTPINQLVDERRQQKKQPISLAFDEAIKDLLADQRNTIAIPRRYTKTMREIWSLQKRLEKRRGKTLIPIVSHPRFRAGYDFLLIRSLSGEVPSSLVQWWTSFQTADATTQQHMVEALHARPKAKKP